MMANPCTYVALIVGYWCALAGMHWRPGEALKLISFEKKL